MKIFIAGVLATFPLMAWSHDTQIPTADILQKSPVALASVATLELFEQNAAGTVWAFKAARENEDVQGEILYLDNSAIARTVKYDCHFHPHNGENEAHCHDYTNDPSALKSTETLLYTVDNFVTALTSALDILNRKVTPVENLVAFKSWQSGGAMHFNLVYQDGASPANSYYMCHFHHGAEIDCHRSLKPGPQEPQY